LTQRRAAAVLAAAVVLGSCAPASSLSDARYVVGEPYLMGGSWSYPREDYALSESGLAVVLPDARRGRRTANGEVHDPAALTAAHRTLQLPSVVVVWNLETGRELRVRVNDRGSEAPGRVIGLSRRAAELLGMRPGETARVRVSIDPALSRAAVEGLPGAEGPRLAIATAPLPVVEREQLAPPPGARASSGGGGGGGRFGAARPAAVVAEVSASSRLPVRLPEEVTQRGIVASRLMLDAGTFFRRDLAERRAAAIGRGGRVQAIGSGRAVQYGVRLGPFATVAQADAALGAALRRGIVDTRIVLD
jgi:rare lipoprotein A